MSGFDYSRHPAVTDATDARVAATRPAAGTPPRGRVVPPALGFASRLTVAGRIDLVGVGRLPH
jgi:hypothetical protein